MNERLLLMSLLNLVLIDVCLAQQDGARFVTPEKGEMIINRKMFAAAVEIDGFDVSSGYYWTATASVKGLNKKERDRILQLRKELMDKDDNKKITEMKKLLGRWEVDLFWPKFYVKEGLYESLIYDGGVNPKSEPQAAILLLLKVDDKLNAYFNEWFDDGPEKGYPGMSISILKKNMLLARCEIFFPLTSYMELTLYLLQKGQRLLRGFSIFSPL